MKFFEISYSVLSFLSFLLIIIKLVIHSTLDRKNNYDTKFAVFSMIPYFLIYERTVNKQDEKLKNLCNRIYKLAIVLLVLSIILLLILNFAGSSIVETK